MLRCSHCPCGHHLLKTWSSLLQEQGGGGCCRAGSLSRVGWDSGRGPGQNRARGIWRGAAGAGRHCEGDSWCHQADIGEQINSCRCMVAWCLFWHLPAWQLVSVHALSLKSWQGSLGVCATCMSLALLHVSTGGRRHAAGSLVNT